MYEYLPGSENYVCYMYETPKTFKLGVLLFSHLLQIYSLIRFGDLFSFSPSSFRDLVDEAKNYLLLPQERPLMQGPRTRPRKPIRCGEVLFAGKEGDTPVTSRHVTIPD